MGSLTRREIVGAALFVAGFGSAGVPARAQFTDRVFRYDPVVSTLIGLLRTEAVDADSDAPGTIYLLTLDAPISVLGDPYSEYNRESEDLQELQLARDVRVAFKDLVGRRVKAAGTLFHSRGPHHHTKVLLMVSRIEAIAA